MSSIFKNIILIVSFISFISFISLNAFAKNENSTEQCIKKAQAVAVSLDAINGTYHATQEAKSRIEVSHNEASLSDEVIVIYTFGTGESLFEVVIKPNYFEKGDCIFQSAKHISQD
ncbi:MAG: hypothetical protein V4596_09225 [Bdellovibrionota bacterium]